MPSILGYIGQLLWSGRQAGRQADKNLAVCDYLNPTTSILKHFKLFKWIYGANSFIKIDIWPVFELRKHYCTAVFQTRDAIIL